ncbi:MAG: DUF6894 family protein [Sphingobium sp.]|jgi:hypothetical protein
MARYFFNLYECGALTPDVEGEEFDDLDAVRETAIRLARGIMAGEITAGRLCLLCRIEVADEAGAVVMEVPFRDTVVVTGL